MKYKALMDKLLPFIQQLGERDTLKIRTWSILSVSDDLYIRTITLSKNIAQRM